jgi:hypothetical protein
VSKQTPDHMLQQADDDSLDVMRVWSEICREGGCSAEQLRELHQPSPEVEAAIAGFFQEYSPTQELVLESVAMWTGNSPIRPLN